MKELVLNNEISDERNSNAVGISYRKRVILKLALPIIAGLSTQMLLSLVDTAMVGRLPDAQYALAAMGIAFFATWAVISFFSSLSNGTLVLTARSFGSENFIEGGNVLKTSIIIGALLGIVVSVTVVSLAFPLGNLFAADNIVGQYAGSYLFYRFMAIPFFLVTVSFRGFYFGIGKTKIFMIAGITANVLNIAFDYILIYGAFGINGMGLAGAGIGSSLATVVETSIYFAFSVSPGYKNKYNIYRNFKYYKNIARDIVKISLPVSFQSIFTLTGLLLFISIIGITGTLQQAASQTVLSAMFLSYMPAMGFGIAAQTLVGNKIGEKNIKSARQWGFAASKIATTYTIFLGIIFILLPKFVLSVLTKDITIIETGIPLLRIAGFAQIFFGVGFVLSNGLLSAGESLFVMLTDVTINWLVFVPVAYLLGIIFNLGVIGVWTAMPFYTMLYAAIIYAKFKYGKWKKINI